VALSLLFKLADVAPPYPAFAGQKLTLGNREFGGELRPEHMKMWRVVIVPEAQDIK
jgi:hypothetical protein